MALLPGCIMGFDEGKARVQEYEINLEIQVWWTHLQLVLKMTSTSLRYNGLHYWCVCTTPSGYLSDQELADRD
ncbi:hypothetical protein H6P81_016509 [Aristolochia fimbriata]|uniref:Uncharacterized protein n=1 Tax=Aristolochia fimbriata TaxID=158543 RepID=A0AAV7E967_ARIFI|nr:hypothetical protein H6P81_016509 [Aristolochia fimbriata]